MDVDYFRTWHFECHNKTYATNTSVFFVIDRQGKVVSPKNRLRVTLKHAEMFIFPKICNFLLNKAYLITWASFTGKSQWSSLKMLSASIDISSNCFHNIMAFIMKRNQLDCDNWRTGQIIKKCVLHIGKAIILGEKHKNFNFYGFDKLLTQ